MPPSIQQDLASRNPNRLGADSVPQTEVRDLAEAVVKAHAFAAKDKVLTGYLVLYAGLTVARQRTEPWSRRLAALWDEAMDDYKVLYPRNWGELD